MESYLTPAGYGEAELIEKKSRFIGRVWPVESEEEALARIKEIREKHWDATHNVYAYIIRENGIMRYSDDGEPQGTSGMPTLNMFRAEEIQNVCCVITRYFGGTLLGAGGLVRAYSGAAKLALDEAGISRMAKWNSLRISCSYSQFGRVKRLLDDHEGLVENTEFGTDVLVAALVRDDLTGNFVSRLKDMTAGAVLADISGSCFRGVRIK
ncbi:MAG TPA: YigZ family protein [Clostridiales bacterium]|nr:YigZ family protein [Clostridiales bacterium]